MRYGLVPQREGQDMKWEKLLAQMERNPRADWRIEDLERICRQLGELGVSMAAPRRGSHDTVRHSRSATILTIPAHRPVKPVYVMRFVDMIRSIIGRDDGEPV
jgi:predicted RNA binding protein YcfA (HicA-like mRNA interferase family)